VRDMWSRNKIVFILIVEILLIAAVAVTLCISQGGSTGNANNTSVDSTANVDSTLKATLEFGPSDTLDPAVLYYLYFNEVESRHKHVIIAR